MCQAGIMLKTCLVSSVRLTLVVAAPARGASGKCYEAPKELGDLSARVVHEASAVVVWSGKHREDHATLQKMFRAGGGRCDDRPCHGSAQGIAGAQRRPKIGYCSHRATGHSV